MFAYAFASSETIQQSTEQPGASAMTFMPTLQADYTRGKSICGKRLVMGFDSIAPEMVTQTVRLKSYMAYALSSDSWRHTGNSRPLQRPAGTSTILEAEA